MSAEVAAELARLLVGLERPAALDEWRLDRRRTAPTPRLGAVSVRDKHGNDVREAA